MEQGLSGIVLIAKLRETCEGWAHWRVAHGLDALWQALLAQRCTGGTGPRWSGARAPVAPGSSHSRGLPGLHVSGSEGPETPQVTEVQKDARMMKENSFLGCKVWK